MTQKYSLSEQLSITRDLSAGKMSPLIKRNVKIDKHRTTIRLEPELWKAFEMIAIQQNTTVNDICTELGKTYKGNSFTSAVRVYIVTHLMKRIRILSEENFLHNIKVVDLHQ